MRFAAPSPEVFKGFRQDLLQTPPKLSPQQRTKLKKKKRSIRIPDFAQLVFKMRVHPPNNALDDPPICLKRVILLVEIKAAIESCEIWYFHGVLDQTDQQARHAFASYPEVDALGVIVALGDCWTYREYFREEMGSSLSPSQSELADPTFRGSSIGSLISPSPSMICEDVNKCFGAKGFARLQDPESDMALTVIRNRLKTFVDKIFSCESYLSCSKPAECSYCYRASLTDGQRQREMSYSSLTLVSHLCVNIYFTLFFESESPSSHSDLLKSS